MFVKTITEHVRVHQKVVKYEIYLLATFGLTSLYFTFINRIGLSLNFAGFNVETVEYKNISFTVWDVGGQDKVTMCLQLTYIPHGILYYQLLANVFFCQYP